MHSTYLGILTANEIIPAVMRMAKAASSELSLKQV